MQQSSVDKNGYERRRVLRKDCLTRYVAFNDRVSGGTLALGVHELENEKKREYKTKKQKNSSLFWT
jgi:hypothetical protein